MASKSAAPAGHRSVRTCTECKQAKLRCDSKANYPNPCSRCQSRQLFCTVDASFQRTPARKRIEAMSKELQELRMSQHRETEASTSRSDFASDSGTSPYQDSSLGIEDDLELEQDVVYLGDTAIEASLVADAIKVFANGFRPHFPITGAISATQMYNHRPMLFWTMIVVVASRLAGTRYTNLFARLEMPFRQMLQREILNVPLPLHRIQAVLILCVWPLPVDTQPRDPSWLYCGIAIQASRFMSIDRHPHVPSLRTLGVASGSVYERVNTWLGCFYSAISLSMHLGLPPPIDVELDFTTIHGFLSRHTVPSDFATLVRINLVIAKYTNLLNHNVNDSVSSSMIRLLDNELDTIRAESHEDVERGRMIEFNILDAKLHFYAFYITRIGAKSVNLELVLKSALPVAMRIIHISSVQAHGGTPGRENIQLLQKIRAYPKNFFRAIVFATMILLKFFHLNSNAAPEERQPAANHIAMAREVFKAAAMDPLDEYGRAARVLEILSRLEPDSTEPTRLRITHRMGLSIVLDVLTRAYEVRGMPTEIPEHQLPENLSLAAQEELRHSEHAFPEMPYTMEQINSSLDFLRDFWEDPVRNMFSLEDMHGEQAEQH